jgi:single stranded DNA-binding protein
MASFNKVILMGNLTRDPEVRYTTGGSAVCDITLAINHNYTDKRSNERREEVSFIDITLWGRTAEIAGEYLAKGRPVLIEGRLQQDKCLADVATLPVVAVVAVAAVLSVQGAASHTDRSPLLTGLPQPTADAAPNRPSTTICRQALTTYHSDQKTRILCNGWYYCSFFPQRGSAARSRCRKPRQTRRYRQS